MIRRENTRGLVPCRGFAMGGGHHRMGGWHARNLAEVARRCGDQHRLRTAQQVTVRRRNQRQQGGRTGRSRGPSTTGSTSSVSGPSPNREWGIDTFYSRTPPVVVVVYDDQQENKNEYYT